MSCSNHKRVQTSRRSRAPPNPDLALSAKRTSGQNDPPSTPRTIRVMHKLRFESIPADGFTYASLFKAIPGQAPTTPYWKHLRLQKVSIWDTNGKGEVSLSFPNDAVQFVDNGVVGSKSSVLHVLPPLMTRIAWVPVTDLTTVAFNASTPSGEQFVCHATVEVNSG